MCIIFKKDTLKQSAIKSKNISSHLICKTKIFSKISGWIFSRWGIKFEWNKENPTFFKAINKICVKISMPWKGLSKFVLPLKKWYMEAKCNKNKSVSSHLNCETKIFFKNSGSSFSNCKIKFQQNKENPTVLKRVNKICVMSKKKDP